MLNYTKLFTLSVFLFLLFPGMCVPGVRYFPCMLPVLLLETIIFILIYKKNNLSQIIQIIQISTTKYLAIFFLITIIFQSTLLFFMKITLSNYLYYTYIVLFLNIIFPYFVGFCNGIIVKTDTVKKLFFFLFLAMFVYSIIQFVGFKYQIGVLTNLDLFINNEAQVGMNVKYDIVAAFGNILPRIKSVFKEPSTYAYFLVINIPLIYYFIVSKYDFLCINKFFKHILRYIFATLFAINLLLTQSPIFIIFSGVAFIILFYFNNKIKVKNIFIGMLFIISAFLLLYFHNFETILPLSRIYYTLNSITSFNKIILVEPSLGTRLVQFINSYIVFSQNWFLGTGLGQMNSLVSQQLVHSPVILTPEIVHNIQNNFNYINVTVNTKLLVEFGLLPTIIYYFIFANVIGNLKKLKKEKFTLVKSLRLVFLMFLIFSFYNSSLYIYYIYVLLGIYCAITLKMKAKNYENR